MARIDRRRLLKLSGAGAIAAGTGGGLATILASGRAPAYAQGTSIHWLRWSDFVPASDQLLRNKIVPQGEKALGLKLNLETINANDLQARVTAAIQSGTGPDIIMLVGTWPQLYTESVVDVSDVVDEIARAQGGYYDIARVIATVGNKWIGVPWSTGGGLLTYRKSWFEEIGYGDGKFPQTWDEYRAAGKQLKAKGRPLGQTLGHTFGDAPGFWYPYLWSWAGKEVEADGKTVVLNSKETIDSVKYAVPFWKEAHDEGGLAWDDSEKGTPLWKDILHAPLPKGAGGQFNLPGANTHMLMSYSKNQKAAKDFLRWVNSKEIFEQWFTSQQGYTSGATRYWEEDPVWNVDPILLPFRDIPNKGRLVGYAGPPSRAAAEAVTKYIIVDMYAKAVQGMPAEDAVKWAHDELVKVYA